MRLNSVFPSNRSGVNCRELSIANPSTRGHDDTRLMEGLEGPRNQLDEERLPPPSDFPTVSHSHYIQRNTTNRNDDPLAYNRYESNSTSFFVTSANSLSGIVDLERDQNQNVSSVTRRSTHHSVSNRTSSAASVSFPKSLLCMTRYTYSAVAALIYPTVSYFYEAGTPQDPHHRELMPEEFGSLVQPGCKNGRECQ